MAEAFMRIGAIGFLMLLAACTSQPERVFVPGTPFRHVVAVRTSQGRIADARVGDWVILHARRSTGPWTNVDRKSLGPDGCWVGVPPPADEEEVATDLRWVADPPGSGLFDNGLRSDHTRHVRFTKPGRYTLKATSSTWCSPKVDSHELIVVVRP